MASRAATAPQEQSPWPAISLVIGQQGIGRNRSHFWGSRSRRAIMKGRSYWIPGSSAPTVSEKGNAFLRLLKNKGFKEERMATMRLDDLGTSTTLESNKSHGHKSVNHGRGEFARDDDGDGVCEVHVNTMEGFWSRLRSWLRPHRGISQAKLPVYLGFFEFVHNVRKRGKALLPALIEFLVT